MTLPDELIQKIKVLEGEKHHAEESNKLLIQQMKELELERNMLQVKINQMEEKYDYKIEMVRKENQENLIKFQSEGFEIIHEQIMQKLMNSGMIKSEDKVVQEIKPINNKERSPLGDHHTRNAKTEISDKEHESNSEEVDEKIRRRKSAKNKPTNQSKLSRDSVFDSTESSGNEDSSLYETPQRHKHKEIRFISEVPRVEPYDPAKGQSIHKFFTDYENYCEAKFPSRPDQWIKDLKNCLTGKLLVGYEGMTHDGTANLKYEPLKERIIEHALRIKKSVKQGGKKDFDKLQYQPGENLLYYAMRLETAGRLKYGEREIRENKGLIFRKFVETVPDEARNYFHQRRNDAKRYGGKKYTWNDALQDLEDQDLDFATTSIRTVNMEIPRTTEYSTYKEALSKSLMDEQNSQLLFQIKTVFDHVQKEALKEQRDGQHYENYNQQRYNNQDRSQSRERDNRNCTYCYRTGHEEENCKLKLGLCFKCGGRGHLATDCPTPPWCSNCRRQGHTRNQCREESNSNERRNQVNRKNQDNLEENNKTENMDQGNSQSY